VTWKRLRILLEIGMEKTGKYCRFGTHNMFAGLYIAKKDQNLLQMHDRSLAVPNMHWNTYCIIE
jgi:hypothetical protein